MCRGCLRDPNRHPDHSPFPSTSRGRRPVGRGRVSTTDGTPAKTTISRGRAPAPLCVPLAIIPSPPSSHRLDREFHPVIRCPSLIAGAPVAQLDRASASGAEGHRFKSCQAHHQQAQTRITTAQRPPHRTYLGGPLAQLVEQLTLNQRAVGSTPTRPTKNQSLTYFAKSTSLPTVLKLCYFRPVGPESRLHPANFPDNGARSVAS